MMGVWVAQMRRKRKDSARRAQALPAPQHSGQPRFRETGVGSGRFGLVRGLSQFSPSQKHLSAKGAKGAKKNNAGKGRIAAVAPGLRRGIGAANPELVLGIL